MRHLRGATRDEVRGEGGPAAQRREGPPRGAVGEEVEELLHRVLHSADDDAVVEPWGDACGGRLMGASGCRISCRAPRGPKTPLGPASGLRRARQRRLAKPTPGVCSQGEPQRAARREDAPRDGERRGRLVAPPAGGAGRLAERDARGRAVCRIQSGAGSETSKFGRKHKRTHWLKDSARRGQDVPSRG